MFEIPEDWSVVLDALIQAPVAWQSPEEVAIAIGLGVDETTDILCALDLAGWVVVWDSTEGPYITLSPLGAERLAVRLVEVGPAGTLRWAPLGDPSPPEPRSKNVCVTDRAAYFEFVTDPTESPADAISRFESLPARPGTARKGAAGLARPDDLPRPTQLVGVGLTPWPGPVHNAEELATCPVCGSRKLLPQMYCLYCDRWGLDRLLPDSPDKDHSASVSASASARPDSPKPARSTKVESLLSEQSRARRKAKRRRLHARSVEAARLTKSRGKGTDKSNPDRPPSPPSPNEPPVSQPSPRFSQPPASGRQARSDS
jgi:hypothetical protein